MILKDSLKTKNSHKMMKVHSIGPYIVSWYTSQWNTLRIWCKSFEDRYDHCTFSWIHQGSTPNNSRYFHTKGWTNSKISIFRHIILYDFLFLLMIQYHQVVGRIVTLANRPLLKVMIPCIFGDIYRSGGKIGLLLPRTSYLITKTPNICTV